MSGIIEITQTHPAQNSKNVYEGLCVIKNFYDLHHDEGDDFASSPFFYTGLNDKYKWTLDIFEAGCDEKHSKYVGIGFYLANAYQVNPDELIGLRFTTSMVGEDGQRSSSKSALFANDVSNYAIFKDFLLREDLSIKHVLSSELKIAFEMSFDAPSAGEEITPSEKNQLKILGKVFDAGKFADVKFIVAGKEFNVHRAILAARSPVFEAMFNSEMRESHEAKVEITDIEADVMEKLLRFVYVGNVKNFEDAADKILVAAEKYQIDELKQLCEDVLVHKLCPSNVYDTLRFADDNNAENLKKKTIEFFHRNAKELSSDVNYKAHLNTLPGHLKTDIISVFTDNL